MVALAGALRVIGTVTAALGIAGRKDEDPWHGAVSDAHPLDYVEARDESTVGPWTRAPLRAGGLRHWNRKFTVASRPRKLTDAFASETAKSPLQMKY